MARDRLHDTTLAPAASPSTGVGERRRQPLIGAGGRSLLTQQLDPCFSVMDLTQEGTYVCKTFSPRCYVIQKVAVDFVHSASSANCFDVQGALLSFYLLDCISLKLTKLAIHFFVEPSAIRFVLWQPNSISFDLEEPPPGLYLHMLFN